MGVKKDWTGLPFEDISVEQLLKICIQERLSLALDLLGSFYGALLDPKNMNWLNVSKLIYFRMF